MRARNKSSLSLACPLALDNGSADVRTRVCARAATRASQSFFFAMVKHTLTNADMVAALLRELEGVPRSLVAACALGVILLLALPFAGLWELVCLGLLVLGAKSAYSGILTVTSDAATALFPHTTGSSGAASAPAPAPALPDVAAATTLSDVAAALKAAGVADARVVVGIDFSVANRDQGAKTFEGRALHAVDGLPAGRLNPYQAVLAGLERALPASMTAKYGLAAVGFGDATTTDQDVFVLADGAATWAQVREQYESAARARVLDGPTSLVPLIEEASAQCEDAGGALTLLIVISTEPLDFVNAEAVAALREARRTLPLVVVVLGVGDGPFWELETEAGAMDHAGRAFHDFTFVDYEQLKRDGGAHALGVAKAVLARVPAQVAAFKAAGLLRHPPATRQARCQTCAASVETRPLSPTEQWLDASPIPPPGSRIRRSYWAEEEEADEQQVQPRGFYKTGKPAVPY